MLADFLHAKQLLGNTVNEFIKNSINAYLGPFAGIDQRVLVEGNSFGHSQSGAPEKDVELKLINADTQIDVDQIKADRTYSYMWRQFQELAGKMAAKQLEDTFETLKEATKSVGNDFPIQEFTPSVVLDMWQKMDIGFTDSGEPILPGIYTFNREMLKKYNESVDKIKETPELTAKMEEIIRVKKIIWDDRESHRKLVD